MHINWLILLAAALVPMAVGMVYYNPKVFGKAWLRASGVDEAKAKQANMLVVFGLSFVFCFFLALTLNMIVIHQMAVYSIMAGDPGYGDPNSEVGKYLQEFMLQHGHKFRTFKHGALHGFLSGLLFALPILGVNALFESKGFKYIAINTGYWVISLALMGGVICAWA